MRKIKLYNRILAGLGIAAMLSTNLYSPFTTFSNVFAEGEGSTSTEEGGDVDTASEEISTQDLSETGSTSAGSITGNNVNVRTAAGTKSACVYAGTTKIQLNVGNTVTVLGTETIADSTYPKWYKISFTYNGSTYTGYVSTKYVSITTTPSANTSTDLDFETKLTAQGFPESYKVYLRQIHTKYPNWEFYAVKTGLDWNTVIENERNKSGQVKNLVQGTSSIPHYNWRATAVGYNWATDTWAPYDGTTWFAASDDLIRYYMDPRTYLSETYIYCFESLNYMAGVQTQAGVESILAGSFMSNTKASGSTSLYSAIMLQSGVSSNVSPYHIASRIKQEIGTTASGSVTGTNSKYPGIYNFYNIGANDSAGGGAIEKGLKWAASGSTYNRPWNTPEKSITGGAMYIGENYILRGQNTLYTQKFNVTYKGALYSHQYMSNVQAPSTEAAKLATAYKSNGLANNKISFSIPVYNNMPASACAKPADTGSPNNWLKSLSVSNLTLTPTFGVNSVNDYSLIVPYTTTSLNISGTAVNSTATIKGTGTVGLNVGTNYLQVNVTAGNGSVRTYNITVIRKAADGSTTNTTNNNISFNTGYSVQTTTITGVGAGTTASNFISALGVASGTSVTVYKADGATVNSGTVGTGNIIKVVNGSTTKTYTVVIYGDLNGDGAISSEDLLALNKHIVGANTLSGAFATASDIDKNSSVGSSDLLSLKKHLVGASTIKQ